jgi:hypothetical protein
MKTVQEKQSAIIEYFGGEKPIMIGDCLEKIEEERDKERPYRDMIDDLSVLVRLWQPCGFSKSLQDIFVGDVRTSELREDGNGGCYSVPCSEFRNTDTQSLLDFLYSLTQEDV